MEKKNKVGNHAEENKKLLKKYLVDGDKAAYDRLIEINFDLVKYYTLKFIHNDIVDYKEFVSIATDGLINAINKFDISRIDDIKFSTFATMHIKNRIVKELKKMDKYKTLLNFSDLEDEGIDVENELSDNEDFANELLDELNLSFQKDKLQKAFKELNEVDKEVIEYVYGFKTGETFTLAKVAEMMGVSKSMIYLRLNRGLDVLRKAMMKERYSGENAVAKKVVVQEKTKYFFDELFKGYDKKQVMGYLKNFSRSGLVCSYYGLGTKKCMSYEEIAENKEMLVSDVKETISRIVNTMRADFKFEELKSQGFDDDFYEMFKGYSKENIDNCVNKFHKKYQCILLSYYGVNRDEIRELAKEYNINVSEYYYKIRELKQRLANNLGKQSTACEKAKKNIKR